MTCQINVGDRQVATLRVLKHDSYAAQQGLNQGWKIFLPSQPLFITVDVEEARKSYTI